MASFAFVPRRVAKGKGKALKQEKSPSAQEIRPPPSVEPSSQKVLIYSNADYVALTTLALSDYSLWSDPNLRQNEDPEGFISLKLLLETSEVLVGLDLENSETLAAKALRQLAQDKFEVRLTLKGPSWSSGSHDNSGMYQVRRTDQKSRVDIFTRDYWESRTVYIERIPIHYRSAFTIFHFIQSLLSTSTPIESISFPPHHLDKHDDIPKCKGFAFVIFSHLDDASRFLESWPWDRRHHSNDEPSRFGFRTMSKSRWLQLKEEYLIYSAKLVSDMSRRPLEEAPPLQKEKRPYVPESLPTIELSYPPNRLVFIRNLHPETNKTTIRKLCSRALASNEAIDYVDYNKGMDTCHIRLASPQYSESLAVFFRDHPTSQVHGLDDTGSAPTDSTSAIAIEVVQGRQEELYWDKVPTKVKREAIVGNIDKGIARKRHKK